MLFREWENMNFEKVDNLNRHPNSQMKSSRNSCYDVYNLSKLSDECTAEITRRRDYITNWMWLY